MICVLLFHTEIEGKYGMWVEYLGEEGGEGKGYIDPSPPLLNFMGVPRPLFPRVFIYNLKILT